MLYDKKWNYHSPIARNLLAAAAAIRTYGWSHRGGLIDDQGRLCVHGAICSAVGDLKLRWSDANVETCKALATYLRGHGFAHQVTSDYGCAYWNNTLERTEQDVLDALEAAAEMVEAKEK